MAEPFEVAEENPIAAMIDYISHSEYTKANQVFNELIGQRVSDTLDQEKIAVAQNIYSDEEDEDDDEYTDDELEDALEDEEDE
tara:strand:+ start:377 stop:625 length:249 start_codon:yes stop_codon:yes gene_type:complete